MNQPCHETMTNVNTFMTPRRKKVARRGLHSRSRSAGFHVRVNVARGIAGTTNPGPGLSMVLDPDTGEALPSE
jgi:hypothetical protein